MESIISNLLSRFEKGSLANTGERDGQPIRACLFEA